MRIETTSHFEKEARRLAKKYPSIYKDILSLIGQLEKTPEMGTPLGHHLYKIRMAIKSKNQGKSGGARVITCVQIVDDIIYLTTIYDKSEREDITDKELKTILKELGL
ncbi:type II toxin-antitoxin system RelE/ParE family toxin [Chitinophaga japonensis]|uniref:mRNA-degrading endonuclease RelE of RelBE toxin-antitoxin system n=1 Tax=Chitinophaga japonensis TaxID=104662 RepID=A0A562T6B7_CHIJA|nr:type II toxin-antitoxin system RelE/ParE family toxin [Chitinophaga japonensis]TWI88550.1 hypothetical protein LX66_2635 [Chitinophaga japonensis]